MNPVLAAFRRLLEQGEAKLRERFGNDAAITDRVKLLISAAAGIVLLSALFGFHQAVSGMERRYSNAQTNLARLKAQVATDVWTGRKAQSFLLKGQLEDRLWTALTPGLADASFERWLRDHLTRYKIEPQQQIQVRQVPVTRQGGGGPDALADINRITAKVILPFNSEALTGFLSDIAEADKTIVVDRLEVRPGRNARIEIDVSALYRSRERS